MRLVEEETGRLLGTVDGGAAHGSAHAGAVYVHQGETYLVRSLDLAEHVAMLERAAPDYTTFARDVTDIRVLETATSTAWGPVELSFGTVQVTNQVVSFLRKRMITGEVLVEEPLDLPPRNLRTRSVWWTVTPEVLAEAGLELGRRTGGRARGRARRDRPAAAVRDLRPVGHRRRVDRDARGHRRDDDLRLRRPSRRRRLRRAGLRVRPSSGSPRPATPSRPASAPTAARPACSRRSAATATTRWTSSGAVRLLTVALRGVPR